MNREPIADRVFRIEISRGLARLATAMDRVELANPEVELELLMPERREMDPDHSGDLPGAGVLISDPIASDQWLERVCLSRTTTGMVRAIREAILRHRQPIPEGAARC